MQRLANRPLVMQQAPAQGASLQADAARPLAQRVALAVVRQDAIRPLIVALLQLRRPAHVARFVVAVVIDAVERVAERWTRADIGVENFERIAPALAHADAASAVGLIGWIIRIVAALSHAAPCRVFGSGPASTHARRLSVREVERATNLGGSTAARRAPTAGYVRNADDSHGTAVASTLRVVVTAPLRLMRYHSPSVKSRAKFKNAAHCLSDFTISGVFA